MKADKLDFYLKDRLSPGVLQELGQKNHTYVIMPMRI
jgi:DNA polymerase III sliding clamp (beta) subunit (PCNA family)